MNKKIKLVLDNVGWLVAAILGIVFIIAALVMVLGFSKDAMTWEDYLWYVISSAINGVFALLIGEALKTQGGIYAKLDNQELFDAYYGHKTKDRKLHRRWFYRLTSGLTDVLTKGVLILGTSLFIVKIGIDGSHDTMMLLMSIGTLCLAYGCGVMSMSRSYDDYVKNEVPFMREGIEARKKEQINNEEIPNE